MSLSYSIQEHMFCQFRLGQNPCGQSLAPYIPPLNQMGFTGYSVSVDEEVTAAVAATAVVFRSKSIPMTDVRLTVVRPFLFLIRDKSTGMIVFLGRVFNP